MAIVFNCAECGKLPTLVGGKLIYPHRPDLHTKKFYLCLCGAYVGCHQGTENSLGSPAHGDLRKARIAVHALFDPLWQRKMEKGFKKKEARNSGYAWLAEKMEIAFDDCHVSQFNLTQCNQAIKILKNWNI